MIFYLVTILPWKFELSKTPSWKKSPLKSPYSTSPCEKSHWSLDFLQNIYQFVTILFPSCRSRLQPLSSGHVNSPSQKGHKLAESPGFCKIFLCFSLLLDQRLDRIFGSICFKTKGTTKKAHGFRWWGAERLVGQLWSSSQVGLEGRELNPNKIWRSGTWMSPVDPTLGWNPPGPKDSRKTNEGWVYKDSRSWKWFIILVVTIESWVGGGSSNKYRTWGSVFEAPNISWGLAFKGSKQNTDPHVRYDWRMATGCQGGGVVGCFFRRNREMHLYSGPSKTSYS